MTTENEEAKWATENMRSELHKLLVKKLITKYGDENTGMGIKAHPINRLIQAKVDLFMHSNKTIGKGHLAELERTVRRATSDRGSGSEAAAATRPHTAGPRPSTSRRCANNGPYRSSLTRQGDHAMASEASPTRRPGTAGSSIIKAPARGNGHLRVPLSTAPSSRSSGTDRASRGGSNDGVHVPRNIKNEWLILETYQQLQTEDKQAEEYRQAQEAIRRCKDDLEHQMALNRVRAEKEKVEEEARKDEQRRMVAEHELEQTAFKEASRQKLLEEKCIRASQILENARRREQERIEKKIDEERTLAECKRAVDEDKQLQLRKRQQIAESLRAMRRENEVKLAVRERQKELEAEEDKRLMREYQERLDREQAERAAAHRRRTQRYEMIGAQWAETGAGKRQYEIDVAEERRILAEATAKEKADEDRERRDKEALRRDRALCLEDNKRLMAEKRARQHAEEVEEAKYASQFRSDGEDHAAKGIDRKRETIRKQKGYAKDLRQQMRATRAARAAVEMTGREREMNGRTLRLLQEDRVLQEKISRRLLDREPTRRTPAVRSTGGN